MDDRFVRWRLIGVRVVKDPIGPLFGGRLRVRSDALYAVFFNVSALLRITSYLGDLSFRASSTHLLFYIKVYTVTVFL